MTDATTTKTTCQICARNIKANTGVIAHHGYQRPGTGWQTSSCDGAKHLPYEQSRDLIPVVIKRYEQYRKNNEEREKDLLANPPATITRFARYSYGTDQVVARPADFSVEAALAQSTCDPSRDDQVYNSEYRDAVETARRNQRDIKAAIEQLQARYEAWPGVVSA